MLVVLMKNKLMEIQKTALSARLEEGVLHLQGCGVYLFPSGQHSACATLGREKLVEDSHKLGNFVAILSL